MAEDWAEAEATAAVAAEAVEADSAEAATAEADSAEADSAEGCNERRPCRRTSLSCNFPNPWSAKKV